MVHSSQGINTGYFLRIPENDAICKPKPSISIILFPPEPIFQSFASRNGKIIKIHFTSGIFESIGDPS
jgi:hypothetical protein